MTPVSMTPVSITSVSTTPISENAYSLWTAALFDLTFTAQSVVASRMLMFAGAPFAKRGRIASETRRMVTEKLAAVFNAQTVYAAEAVRLGTDIATGRASMAQIADAPLHLATCAIEPVARRANANARRFKR